MARVEFFRDFKDDDPSYDEVFIDGKRLGCVEQLLETDYLDKLGVTWAVVVGPDKFAGRKAGV